MIDFLYKLFIYVSKYILPPNIFARVVGVKFGKNCKFYTKHFGSEPFLIEIGDDVQIAGNVHFWNHGGAWPLRKKYRHFDYFGKIIIKNNVYIGSGVGILPGVTIGNNVIVGAMSCVTKSIPDNSIVAGNPAKVISNIKDFESKLLPYKIDSYGLGYFRKKNYLKNNEVNYLKKSSL